MKNKGLSFIEILVAVFILGLIALLLGNLLTSFFDLYFGKIDEQEFFSNTQIILDKLARDIRQGREVLYISTNTLTINLSTGVTHTYSLVEGANGKKYFALDGEILAGPIENITFTGCRLDGTFPSNPKEIRFITFTLTMANGENYSSIVGLRAEVPLILGGIVITEIMYDLGNMPLGRNKRYEFIEIQNVRTYSVNLEGWKIKINSSVFNFSSSNFGWTISPNQYIVIGGQNFDPNLYSNPKPSSIIISNGDFPFNLYGYYTNTITLLDVNNNIIDMIIYTYGWGGKFDSSTYSCFSLERKDPLGATQDMSNWTSSINFNTSNKEGSKTYYIYATPGGKNSVSP